MKRYPYLFILLILASFHTFSQGKLPPTPADTGSKLVDWIYSDKFRSERKDSLTEVQTMVGKVHLKQANTQFYCDSAIYNKQSKIVEAFGNVHINDADSIHTYSQYLLYHVDSRVAYLRNKVHLTDKKISLYTDSLRYDANQKIGDYYNGGRVVNGNTVLTSKEGTYYGELKDVYFKKNVVLVDPQYNLKTDSLLYNTTSELATFITKTFIEDSAKRNITTSEGYYDLKNKKAEFGLRPIIEDKKARTRTIANSVVTDDKTGITKLSGNAVHIDSAQGVSVLANYIESRREDGSFFATQSPLMIIKQDKDSIYVAADTLFSGRLGVQHFHRDSSAGSEDTLKGITVVSQAPAPGPGNDSANRYFKAFHHVRIFSDSMQAVCDSLYYTGVDSVFRLFTDPVVWSGENQITGDTIYMYTKNKQPHRVYVFENALAVNKIGKDLYNQLKGNRITAYFVEGNIDYMRAKGNAESIYYVQDEDSAFVGVNKVAGDIIDLRFKHKELDRVVVISEPSGTMIPFKEATEQDRFLRSFKWREARRPKTKYELFGN